ncbi:hypothetical protein [Kitasatospora sp. NPDC086791]|uniref:hypothetical protein n=1 Tax=Kitasatospora sp. NPDC086791 TaxID=3155178 RepID=UPI00342B2043
MPGTTYSVTYAPAGNPEGGPALRTGRTLIDGRPVQDVTFDLTGRTKAAMGYVGRQFTFVAQNSATTLGSQHGRGGVRAGDRRRAGQGVRAVLRLTVRSRARPRLNRP